MHKASLILSILLLLSACSFDRMKEDGTQRGGGAQRRGGGDATRPISYQEVYGAVLASRCVGCHSQGGGDQGGLNLETYEKTAAIASRIERSVFVDKTMPKGQTLTDPEAQVLMAWLKQGATRNGRVGESNSKLKENITWAVVRNEIFARKCLECHSQPRPEGNLDLSTVAEARAKISQVFDRAILTNDETKMMPLPPIERLTTEEKQALATWIAIGMPE